MFNFRRFAGSAASVAAIVFSSSAALAGPMAYEATSNGGFGLIDLSSGVFSARGNSGVQLAGLAVGTDGTLYSGHYRGSEFYRIDPLTGATTMLGTSSGMNYIDIGSTLSGIYGLGTDQFLYSINASNGAATRIGNAGFTQTILGMSTGSADLYVSWESRTGPTLYNVSTTTANSVLVGYPSASFGALVTINGTLYGGADPSNAVYTVSTANGASTFQANVVGTTNTFYGLAAAPADAIAAVPEPTTWGLMLVGFGATGIAMRRRAKVRTTILFA